MLQALFFTDRKGDVVYISYISRTNKPILSAVVLVQDDIHRVYHMVMWFRGCNQ